MIADLLLMLIAFSGMATGIIIGRYAYEELKPGEKYFIIFKNTILVVIAVFLALNANDFVIADLLFFATGFVVAYFLRFNYLFLGLSSAVSIMLGKQLFVMPLIYVYGLPFGTVRYYHIRNHARLVKAILVNFIMFVVPLAVLYFDFDVNMLVMFSAGALIANIR
ncbi:hypothetical protein J4231_02460 [Candidatus Woesearchaeota archaeon]|nr:hypothetical protein [Candidatus Woesearchaeota archaeon]